MMESNYRAAAVDYLKTKALNDMRSAEMSLLILLDHPAGIGDHSTGDLRNNLDEALNLLVDANDRIDILKKYNNFG
jgi:hypothetical protein